MWLEALPKPEADAPCCPTCGGGVRKRVHGEMHAGSYLLDGQRVEIRRVPASGFADPISLNARAQYFDGRIYKLWPSSVYFRNQTWLHRAVWEAAFGKIPAGCHIHHRNENETDNRLENLECVPAAEHMSHSSRRSHEKGHPGIGDLARSKAAEWHRSEAGREWHRQHANKSKGWLKWKRVDGPCDWCGKIFQKLVRGNGRAQRWCHPNCKAAAYRASHPRGRKG